MSNVNVYREIVHADFALGRSIVDTAYVTTTSPRKYLRMTVRGQRWARVWFWFLVVFFGLTSVLACVGIGYDPARFGNILLHASIWHMVATPLLILFVFYRFAISQGYLRWMYKHKKTAS